MRTAFAGENQDFLHAAVGDDLHFVFNLLHVQFHALNVVIAVEAAVNAVILAVVGDVQRGKQVNGVAEVLAGFQPGTLRHFLQKGLGGRGEEGLQILNGAGFVLQRRPDVLGGVLGGVVGVHLGEHHVPDIGINLFHPRQILHVAFPAGRVGFQPVLFFQGFRGKVLGIHKKLIFHANRPLNRAGTRSAGPKRRLPGTIPGPGPTGKRSGRLQWPGGRRRPSGAGCRQLPKRCWP